MAYTVDFKDVSTIGLESSPVADTLAGLRANEARYFWNKYKHTYVTYPAADYPEIIEYVNDVLKEKDLSFAAKPLEVTNFTVDGSKWTYVFYEDGLSVNVLYTIDTDKKRAVGFKLADGMEVPAELADKFKFVHQKSTLAGTIRGSYFVVKQEYDLPVDL